MTKNFAFLLACAFSATIVSAIAKDNAQSCVKEQPLPYIICLDRQWDFSYKAIECGLGWSQTVPRGLPGSWNGTYHGSENSTEYSIPKLPEVAEYEAKMPVPGYWDDNIRNLQKAEFWWWAQFNPSYRQINYPIGKESAPPFSTTPYLVGIGYYRTTFQAYENWQSKIITLRIGGVVKEAWVWLNGSFVEHKDNYLTSFEIPLNKFVKTGDNEVIIAVANAASNKTGHPISCATDGYQGLSGGIYGYVNLKVSAAPRIADFYIYPLDSNKKLKWMIELDGAAVTNKTLRWIVREPKSGRVLKSGMLPITDKSMTWTTDNLGMQPWSEHTPNLYEVEISVWDSNTLLDKETRPFGMRLLQRDGIKLRLNGRPVMLRGLCETWYFPKTCTPSSDINYYRDMIRKYKELGFNWVRSHTAIPREEYLQAADELGMMIQVESPRPIEDDNLWMDILRAGRKHPSVVIYCCSNEQLLDEPAIAKAEKWAELCHKMVPDALFSPMEGLRGVEYGVISDFGKDVVLKPYPHNPRRLQLLKTFSDVFEPSNWDYLTFNFTSDFNNPELFERPTTFERPCLMHEVGQISSYLDLDLEHRYVGTRIGTDLYSSIRQNLKEAGLLDKAPLYYRNSCLWKSILYKYVLEKARKWNYIAGYDFLGAAECHIQFWGYACGIMNEFCETKPGFSPAEVLKYNGESVLLLNHTNYRNLTTGAKVQMDILSSLYGSDKLKAGKLNWYLKDNHGQIHSRGEIQLSDIDNGDVKKLGTISFTAPELAGATKLTIFAHLSGGEYEIDNNWDFWVFPKPDLKISAQADTAVFSKFSGSYPSLRPINTADANSLRIVSELDEQTLAFLNNRGKVLLLGSKPFATLPTTFQASSGFIVNGNMATIIANHPIFSSFPHDGFCDWQFYRLLNDANAIVFEDGRIPFDPILEVVSSYKLIRKQAAVFELGVGKGSLLVCSLNIKDTDPAGMYLLYKMIEYAASNSFKPANRVELK